MPLESPLPDSLQSPPAAFALPEIVPWGRRLAEYRAFFDLGAPSLDDLRACPRILDVGGGPASFAAEAAQQGLRVTAVDPLYRLGGDAIRARVAAARPAMERGLEQAADRFDWGYYGSPGALLRMRTEALELFLADYEWGRACGRYRAGQLPALPFAEGAFDLALCSHLLFLYGEALDAAFHVAALAELARVAREVRVFPLLDLEGRRSPHLGPAVAALRAQGLAVEERPVPFLFQKGGGTMLRVWRG